MAPGGDAHVEFDVVDNGSSDTYQFESFSSFNSGGSTNNGVIEALPNLISGDWYELATTYTNDDGLEITLDLEDYGPQGLSTPVDVDTTAFHLSDPVGLTSDKNVYAGFLLDGSGATAIDNFVATPEPSSAALLAFAGLSLLTMRSLRHLTKISSAKN